MLLIAGYRLLLVFHQPKASAATTLPLPHPERENMTIAMSLFSLAVI
jgi:hypothetical protein